MTDKAVDGNSQFIRPVRLVDAGGVDISASNPLDVGATITVDLTSIIPARYAVVPAADAPADVTVKATAGRIFVVSVVDISNGPSADVRIYDGPSATGQLLFAIPWTAALGTCYSVSIPCDTSIVVMQGDKTAGVLVSYS